MSSRRVQADQLPSFDARVRGEPRISFSSSQTGSPGDYSQSRGLVPFEKVDEIMIRVHTTAKVALAGLALFSFACVLGMGYLFYDNTKMKKTQKAQEALLAKVEHELEASEQRIAVAVKDALTRPGVLDSMASLTFQRMLQIHEAQRRAHEEATKSWEPKNKEDCPEGNPTGPARVYPEPRKDYASDDEEEPRLEKRSCPMGHGSEESVTEPEEDFGPEEEEWPEHQAKEAMAAAANMIRDMDPQTKEAIVMATAADLMQSMDPQDQRDMVRIAAQMVGEDPDQAVEMLAQTGFIEAPRVPSFTAEVLSDEEPEQYNPVRSKSPSPVQSKTPSPVKAKSPSPVKPKAKPKGKKGKAKK